MSPRESRPTMGPAPETAAKQSGTSVPARSDVSADADAALFESIVDGVHVVVVRTSNDRYKRRCYLSLAAADKAAALAGASGEIGSDNFSEAICPRPCSTPALRCRPLAAADKAAERARERGDEAAVVLCRLTPVRAGWVR